MTTVLLVDDHELIRQGLASAFERTERLEVVGQAGSVAEAEAAWRALRPDVVVTDLQLPDGSGLDLVRTIRGEEAGTSVDTGLVVLTLHCGRAQVLAAMEAGATAFLGKETRGQVVAQVTEHAARAPRAFVTPGLSSTLVERTRTAGTRLTTRELQVLRLVADGRGTAEIARELYLGESTVKTHLNRIFRKLGVSNRTQALAVAVREGLLVEGLPPVG